MQTRFWHSTVSMKFQILAKWQNFKILKRLMRVARTIRFCTSKFFHRAEIKILPHKQSKNSLRLRKIQEFYRSNKA